MFCFRRIYAAIPAAELGGESTNIARGDEQELEMSYEQIGYLNSLRMQQRCGFWMLREKALQQISDENITKKFYLRYTTNRHKTSILPRLITPYRAIRVSVETTCDQHFIILKERNIIGINDPGPIGYICLGIESLLWPTVFKYYFKKCRQKYKRSCFNLSV